MRVFVLESDIQQIRECIRTFEAIAEPGDVLHIATSFDRAVPVYHPPYDVQLLEREPSAALRARVRRVA